MVIAVEADGGIRVPHADAHGERLTIAGLPGKPQAIAHHLRVGEQLAALTPSAAAQRSASGSASFLLDFATGPAVRRLRRPHCGELPDSGCGEAQRACGDSLVMGFSGGAAEVRRASSSEACGERAADVCGRVHERPVVRSASTPRFRATATAEMLKRAQVTIAKARTRDSMQAFSKLTHEGDGELRISATGH
jgi:hypothetical protein